MMKHWVTKALAILVIVTLLTATFAGSADELDAVEVVFDDVTLEEIAEADDELILDGINGESMADIVIDDIELETAEEGVSERTEQNDPDDVASNALPDEITLGIRETFKLSYRKGWYYSSSDNETAAVSNEGLITAQKRGKATITVKDRDKNVVAKCAVTVKKLPGWVDLNKKKMNLTEGCTYQLEASIPKNTYTSRLTWSSNNKKVAKVSKTGLVTAVKPGKATITVRTGNNKKAKCVVNVVARRELSRYLGWYTKSVVKSIGMKYNHRYTYEEGEDTTISVDVYSKVFTDGGALYIESEDKEHIDDIEFTSIKVAYDGIYVGMNKSQAIMAAKAKGWMKSESDTTYIQYYNDQGHYMYVGLNDGDRKVNYVRVYYNEAFNVIHPEYTAPDGEHYPETDFIEEGYEMQSTANVGDVGTLIISSNVDWTLEQTDSESDWLEVTPKKGNSGSSKIKLEVKDVPENGTYTSELTFTTRSGRHYTGTVSLTKSNEVTYVSLDKSNLSMMIGQTEKLNATIHPSTVTAEELYWFSSDNDVVTVDGSGNVTAIAAGEAEITAEADNGISDTCYVTVKSPKVSFTVRHASDTIIGTNSTSGTATMDPGAYNGDKYTLTINSNYTWTVSASDTSWLTLSTTSGPASQANLVLTLKNIGDGKNYSTKLTFEVNGETRTVTVKLNKPVLAQSISLDRSSVTLKVGETVNLTRTILPSNVDVKSGQYRVSNNSIFKVTGTKNSGNVGTYTIKGVAPGTATLTVETKDGTNLSAVCTVTVVADRPEYIAIEACDITPSRIESVVQDGHTYDRTNYPLDAGSTYSIPFSTGKNVFRVTYTISYLDDDGYWRQYGSLKSTKSYTTGTSGHSGTFSVKLPSYMPSETYLLRVYAKNIDSDTSGDYITLKVNIAVR